MSLYFFVKKKKTKPKIRLQAANYYYYDFSRLNLCTEWWNSGTETACFENQRSKFSFPIFRAIFYFFGLIFPGDETTINFLQENICLLLYQYNLISEWTQFIKGQRCGWWLFRKLQFSRQGKEPQSSTWAHFEGKIEPHSSVPKKFSWVKNHKKAGAYFLVLSFFASFNWISGKKIEPLIKKSSLLANIGK